MLEDAGRRVTVDDGFALVGRWIVLPEMDSGDMTVLVENCTALGESRSMHISELSLFTYGRRLAQLAAVGRVALEPHDTVMLATPEQIVGAKRDFRDRLAFSDSFLATHDRWPRWLVLRLLVCLGWVGVCSWLVVSGQATIMTWILGCIGGLFALFHLNAVVGNRYRAAARNRVARDVHLDQIMTRRYALLNDIVAGRPVPLFDGQRVVHGYEGAPFSGSPSNSKPGLSS
jgi:hypothetical protein